MSTIPSSFAFVMGTEMLSNTSQSGQACMEGVMCGGSFTDANGPESFEAMLSESGSGNSASASMEVLTTATMSPGNVSAIFNFLNNIMSDSEQMLENIMSGANSGNSSSASASQTAATNTNNAPNTANSDLAADYSTDFGQDVLAGLGPLPAFLKEVDAKDGLNATQAQALQDISVEFQNADNSSTTVGNIAAALQKAGIPDTPV